MASILSVGKKKCMKNSVEFKHNATFSETDQNKIMFIDIPGGLHFISK